MEIRADTHAYGCEPCGCILGDLLDTPHDRFYLIFESAGGLSRSAERASGRERIRRPARGGAPQAAAEPRPARRSRRLARPLAGPRAAAPRSCRGFGFCR